MLQGKERAIIDKENSLESRDRQHQKEYLKQIGICKLLNNFQDLNFSRNSSTSLASSFEYELLPSNVTNSLYWLSIALFHRPRYERRKEFKKISSEQSNEKVWHVNTKVLKALCIKGKIFLSGVLQVMFIINFNEKLSLTIFSMSINSNLLSSLVRNDWKKLRVLTWLLLVMSKARQCCFESCFSCWIIASCILFASPLSPLVPKAKAAYITKLSRLLTWTAAKSVIG